MTVLPHAGARAPSPAASIAPLGAGAPDGALPCLEDFLTGEPEQELRDLLAFAMAVQAGQPTVPAALRGRADAALAAHALRHMHNQIESIRLDAAREQMARMRRGPGFTSLVMANLLALALAALLGGFLWLRPDLWLHLIPRGLFPEGGI
ncbi:hypothetical protein [Falsiroseomonas selenitidurans]|uniref:Uncharacterized protein n=1 Tax=Falsiroseomonas selenitidurans TaxID=2716335 RepID=A0ABX1DZG4_9PROT|nr:hypothetical protein [Falsiroseomonas selenitidurans]NKC30279.1 hypothetical protein [Falsiroseomonas selenitidurans]